MSKNHRHGLRADASSLAFFRSPYPPRPHRAEVLHEAAQAYLCAPDRALPDDVAARTGLTEAALANRHIDVAAAETLMRRCDLVVAHNARFDRPFVERIVPAARERPWACSRLEVPWYAEDCPSTTLEGLAHHYGVFPAERHRALADCETGLWLLAQRLPRSHRPVLGALLERAMRPTLRLWAVDAPSMRAAACARGCPLDVAAPGQSPARGGASRPRDGGGRAGVARRTCYGAGAPTPREVRRVCARCAGAPPRRRHQGARAPLPDPVAAPASHRARALRLSDGRGRGKPTESRRPPDDFTQQTKDISMTPSTTHKDISVTPIQFEHGDGHIVVRAHSPRAWAPLALVADALTQTAHAYAHGQGRPVEDSAYWMVLVPGAVATMAHPERYFLDCDDTCTPERAAVLAHRVRTATRSARIAVSAEERDRPFAFVATPGVPGADAPTLSALSGLALETANDLAGPISTRTMRVLFRRLFRKRLTGLFRRVGAGISHIVPVLPDGRLVTARRWHEGRLRPQYG